MCKCIFLTLFLVVGFQSILLFTHLCSIEVRVLLEEQSPHMVSNYFCVNDVELMLFIWFSFFFFVNLAIGLRQKRSMQMFPPPRARHRPRRVGTNASL